MPIVVACDLLQPGTSSFATYETFAEYEKNELKELNINTINDNKFVAQNV